MVVVKMIHPETGVVRSVPKTNGNKIRILERAGFILKKNYKPPKKKVEKPKPTVAEIAEKQGEDPETSKTKLAAKMAVHEGQDEGGDHSLKLTPKKKKKKLRKSVVNK